MFLKGEHLKYSYMCTCARKIVVSLKKTSVHSFSAFCVQISYFVHGSFISRYFFIEKKFSSLNVFGVCVILDLEVFVILGLYVSVMQQN